MGRKKQAHFRIIVADSAAPRDGRFVDTLGYYKPLTRPARLVVDIDRADAWIAKGAEPSNTVRMLLNKARKGGDARVALGVPDPEGGQARRAEGKAREEAVAAAATEADPSTAGAEEGGAPEAAGEP